LISFGLQLLAELHKRDDTGTHACPVDEKQPAHW
jgi:hypothetical protein